MTQEPSPSSPPLRPPSHGRLIATGVLVAFALGGGLGLWARPASPAQEMAEAQPPQPASPTSPSLQIVVDDTPAPIGPLLEVLPGDASGPPPDAAIPPPPPSPPPLPVEPIAPHVPAAGLVKVEDTIVAEPILPAVVKAQPKPMPKIELNPVARPKVAAVKPQKPDQRALARAEEAAKARKAEAARLAKAEQLQRAKALQAQKAEAARLAQVQKVALAAKAKAVRLAKAEPKKPAKVQAAPRRLAALTPKKAPAAPRAVAQKRKPVELAAVRPKPRAVVQRPVVQKAVIRKPPAAKPVRRPDRLVKVAAPKAAAPEPKRIVVKPPPARRPVLRGEGPMRVARANPCNANPYACGAQRLSMRERQLEQAYRNAEAAGVPAEALRRQQARWLNARAAAAREAPWAVEDVYEARISELNDLSRGAREN